MVKIKICGLSRPCDVEAVNIEKSDYIGFVFAPSRRRITPQQALELRKELCPCIIPVGVFVDEEIENIISLIQNGIIDAVQLHGSEDESYVRKLKTLTHKPIIKAITVQDKRMTAADYLMLDSKGGGTGHSFDWNLVGTIETPYFLAGGLSPENIEEAINRTNPFAVDVSSGVETDGFKDSVKVKEFIRRARNE